VQLGSSDKARTASGNYCSEPGVVPVLVRFVVPFERVASMPAGNAHRVLKTMFDSFSVGVGAGIGNDPGDGGTITPTLWGQFFPIVTADTETRTLAQPTRAGVVTTLCLSEDSGDLTLTVTGGYNNDDDTTIVFDDDGDYVTFVSIQEGTSYFWRAIAQEGTDAVVEEGVFDSLNVTTLSIGGTAITATAAEINAAADVVTEAVTTTNVITAAENGTRFVLNSATGFVSTLPAPAAGLEFWFYTGATPPSSGNHTVVTDSSANIILGNIASPEDAAGSVAVVQDADTISFVASKAVHGDYSHVWSDGTNWYLDGMCSVQDGMTTTQAS